MKKILSLALLATTLFSCQKQEAPVVDEPVSQDVLAAISQAGFSTEGVIREEGGYIVEGDIFLSNEHLASKPGWSTMTIAEVEQYHTTNLVKGLPRVITLRRDSKVPAEYDAYIDAMVARYNAQNLQLTFTRVTSGNADITFYNASGSYLASAGFPSSSGAPYGRVNVNTRSLKNYRFSEKAIITVLAHEVGHCIGFRHTDYMNRAYSCGSGGNEGASTVGAIHIPGTPTGPDPNSWMLACLGASTDRPFNANDKTALDYLY